MKTEEEKVHGNGDKMVLNLTIESKEYEWVGRFINGAELRKLSGLSEKAELYLSLEDPFDDEPIGLDTKVDLARPGIERFLVKHKLTLTIDGKKFEWNNQFITGAEIKKLGGVKDGYQVFLKISGPYEDELVNDDERIDLARPGVEHFYGCKPNTHNG